MGILYKTKCYLGCQLQFGDFDQVKKEHDYFKEKTKEIGLTVLSPLEPIFISSEGESKQTHFNLKENLKNGNFDYVHDEFKKIRSRDLAACDVSTFIVAKLNPNIPAFGLTDEIITSKRNGKPVFLILTDGKESCPLWLTSYFKSNWIYRSYDEVIDKLFEINSGKQEIDFKTWKILLDHLK